MKIHETKKSQNKVCIHLKKPQKKISFFFKKISQNNENSWNKEIKESPNQVCTILEFLKKSFAKETIFFFKKQTFTKFMKQRNHRIKCVCIWKVKKVGVKSKVKLKFVKVDSSTTRYTLDTDTLHCIAAHTPSTTTTWVSLKNHPHHS
jgi:hypothetical protein